MAPASPPQKSLAPCQQRALDELLAVSKAGAVLVELRSPAGRGHGITTVLRALASALGEKAALLDISATLGAAHPEQALFKGAAELLDEGKLVIIDDADLAAGPGKLRASRNAGDQFRGAGNFAFEDHSEPMRLLKALQDYADCRAGTVVFSTVEEGHARYMQGPLTVRLEAARGEDLRAVLATLLPGVEAGGLLERLPVWPPIAEFRCAVQRARALALAAGGPVSAGNLEGALRANSPADSAVKAEEVELIELEKLPGMAKIVRSLETHVLFPILNPQVAKQQGLTPKRGVLLYGPPGTGKTTVGRALAHRLQGRFFMIRELLLYKEIFEVFAQARAVAPSVVFFDDIDVLLGGLNGLVEGARGHDLTRFLLSQMDGLCTNTEAQVVVVMAAADAKFLPPAILRSGRIELWLKTETPKAKDRRAMLQHYVDAAARSQGEGGTELLRPPLGLEEVVRASEDFVPADIRRIVSDARNAAAADGAKKAGEAYLGDAAKDLRAMKDDVEGLIGRMYG